ncbi:TRAP transporter small permease [Paracoccus jeotgali]|uniref:TRAP transporter small permease n=1 Tax=Paracoccus jeotgali TaxID=2065379 RepID=UPI0028AF248E|nr:TRAP transporter small permease [Paracoccus jeotgali]
MATTDMLQDQQDGGPVIPTVTPTAMPRRLTPIGWFRAFAGGLSTVGGILAALIMAFMTLHILYEITLRSFFNSSTYVLDEFVGYGVAAMTFLALGDAVSKRALIQVTFLIDWVRAPVIKLMLRLACIGLTGGLVIFLSLQFWKTISRNFARGATSETMAQVPLWIPESLLLAGLVIFGIQLLADALGLFEKPENPF